MGDNSTDWGRGTWLPYELSAILKQAHTHSPQDLVGTVQTILQLQVQRAPHAHGRADLVAVETDFVLASQIFGP